MKIKFQIFILTITLIFISIEKIFAESPITSTIFYTSYSNFPVVEKAHLSGVINDTIAEYLLNDSNAIDVKAAIINALSWSDKGKNNASLLMKHIIKKYNFGKAFDMNLLSAEDIFCLGYLTMMDNYSQTEKPVKILTLASNKKPKSFTIKIVLALSIAQTYNDPHSCDVYKICANVKEDSNLDNDMRQSAIDKIFDFINQYKQYCKN